MDGDPIVIPVPTTDPGLGDPWGVIVVDLQRLHAIGDDAMRLLAELQLGSDILDARSFLMGATYASLYLWGERELTPADQVRLYMTEGVAR